MNCILIDDEATSRLILNQLCSEIDNLTVVAEFENATQAIKYLNKNEVELILLDIHLPDFTGFEFIQTLKVLPIIVLTSSDKNFAIKAYEYDCIADYLVKPILLPRFKKTIQKVNNLISQKHEGDFLEKLVEKVSETELYINVAKRLIKIDIPSIYLIEAKGDYVNLKTIDGNYIVHTSLQNIQNKLPATLFLRIHRSYLINIKKIKSIEDNTVLINKDVIPISRSSRVELMNIINLL
ncbi:MAG: two-component system response regulator LytT [Mariniflexile sp.]|jgi:two-component system response regulator LytT